MQVFLTRVPQNLRVLPLASKCYRNCPVKNLNCVWNRLGLVYWNTKQTSCLMNVLCDHYDRDINEWVSGLDEVTALLVWLHAAVPIHESSHEVPWPVIVRKGSASGSKKRLKNTVVCCMDIAADDVHYFCSDKTEQWTLSLLHTCGCIAK